MDYYSYYYLCWSLNKYLRFAGPPLQPHGYFLPRACLPRAALVPENRPLGVACFAVFVKLGRCLHCSPLDLKNQPSLEFSSLPEFGIIPARISTCSYMGEVSFSIWLFSLRPALQTTSCVAFISLASWLRFDLACPVGLGLTCFSL